MPSSSIAGKSSGPFQASRAATERSSNIHPTFCNSLTLASSNRAGEYFPMPTVTGRAVQVAAAGGAFELVQKQFPEPGPGQVRIRVQACGVCHSDSLTKEGIWPGIQYPRVPGHEVAGVLDAVAA